MPPIPAVGAIGAALPPEIAERPQPAAATESGFSTTLAGAVDRLQQIQSTANDLVVDSLSGTLADAQAATIAATQAQLTLEVAAAVRDKGIAAFNQIMSMQA